MDYFTVISVVKNLSYMSATSLILLVSPNGNGDAKSYCKVKYSYVVTFSSTDNVRSPFVHFLFTALTMSQKTFICAFFTVQSTYAACVTLGE